VLLSCPYGHDLRGDTFSRARARVIDVFREDVAGEREPGVRPSAPATAASGRER
jgi:hypothetical protein